MEHGVLHLVVYEVGGRVVVALYLVADDLHLLVYLGLWVRAVEHYVGEQVHGTGYVVAQYGGVVHGLLLVGEGVEVAAHALEAVHDVPCAAVRGALERHVLAEVGHALLAWELVARAGVHGIAAVHHL